MHMFKKSKKLRSISYFGYPINPGRFITFNPPPCSWYRKTQNISRLAYEMASEGLNVALISSKSYESLEFVSRFAFRTLAFNKQPAIFSLQEMKNMTSSNLLVDLLQKIVTEDFLYDAVLVDDLMYCFPEEEDNLDGHKNLCSKLCYFASIPLFYFVCHVGVEAVDSEFCGFKSHDAKIGFYNIIKDPSSESDLFFVQGIPKE